EAAVLLGHGQGQEPVLAEQFQIPARKLEFVVRALGVVAHFLLAELDQRGPQLFVPFSQHPVGIPVVAEAPERLGTPHLFLAQPDPFARPPAPSRAITVDGVNLHYTMPRLRRTPARRKGTGGSAPTAAGQKACVV